ncbi:MAG: galactose-1-phosphate uridylyltransferase [Pseudomonadota bacterium]
MPDMDKDVSIELQNAIGDRSVHRRTIVRADSRQVHLYGYSQNRHPILQQDNEAIARGGERRWHPLRQEWNIYAAHRQNRTFKPASADNPLAPTRPDGPATEIPVIDFELAVFENKYSSLHFKAPAPKPGTPAKTAPAAGHCEVIVYGPEPTGNLYSIGQKKRRLLLAAWTDRYQEMFNMGCEYVLPFENRGEDVGVTLHHPHGQIYGFDYLPPAQFKAVDAFNSGYDLSTEMRNWAKNYIVASAGNFSAYCPPFARFPFEVWIAPQSRKPGPWTFTDEDADAFAYLIGDITRRYDVYFDQPTPYMFALHAAPRSSQELYHFTAQFYPMMRAPGQLKYLASVEQHTGTFTVDVMPEAAAQILKGC